MSATPSKCNMSAPSRWLIWCEHFRVVPGTSPSVCCSQPCLQSSNAYHVAKSLLPPLCPPPHLPLSHHFSVQNASGAFLDLLNPASRVPIVDSVAMARVVALAAPPAVAQAAVLAEAQRVASLRADSHMHRSRASSQHNLPRQQQQPHQQQQQQQQPQRQRGPRRSSNATSDRGLEQDHGAREGGGANKAAWPSTEALGSHVQQINKVTVCVHTTAVTALPSVSSAATWRMGAIAEPYTAMPK